MESEICITLYRVVRKWQLSRDMNDAVNWGKNGCKCTQGKCTITRKSLWLDPTEEEGNEKRVKKVKLCRLYRALKIIKRTFDFIYVWHSSRGVLRTRERHNLTYKNIPHAAMLRVGFREMRMEARRSIKGTTTLTPARDDSVLVL